MCKLIQSTLRIKTLKKHKRECLGEITVNIDQLYEALSKRPLLNVLYNPLPEKGESLPGGLLSQKRERL